MAEAYSMAVAPHNPNGPVATAAAVHFALATPNWLIQEAITSDVPWRDEVVEGGTEVRDGYTGLPAGPGLGIEINEREAARHPFRPEAEQRYFHPDGSVADW
jgi:galactonate dehydratase